MKGEVRVRLRCLMPGKLIARALDMGVQFDRIIPEDRGITAELNPRDARKLIRLCRRYAISAEIVSRKGGAALAGWLRRRRTLAAGLLAALLLSWLCLGRLWTIDIRFIGDNADAGDRDALLAALRDMGVHPGADREIDTARLADAMMSAAGNLSYVGARVEGVRLVVEAAPEIEPPEVYDVDRPRSLYADRDGIVVSVNAEAGEACVKPGDTVRRGQLLIRGAERSDREETRPIAALGEVVVRTWFEGAAEGRLREAQVRYTGRQSASATLVTPWFEYTILEGERYGNQSLHTCMVPIGGLYAPLAVRRTLARETRFVMETGDRVLLSSRLTALAMADARARLAQSGLTDFKIARSWIRYNQSGGDLLRASAVCEIYTNAAVYAEALQQGG